MRIIDPPAGWRTVKTCRDGGTVFCPSAPGIDSSSAARKPQTRSTVASGGPGAKGAKTFPTLERAIAAAARNANGRHVCTWTYHTGDGREAFHVARFDLDQLDPDTEKPKKRFRPIHRNCTGWRIGDPPGHTEHDLLPLYRLPHLSGQARTFIVEGERCADEAAAIGLPVTTSAHGSKSAGKTNWRTLSDRDCIIIPDADEAGTHYAETVAGILHRQGCTVRIVNLPDLPAGSGADVADFIAERRIDGKDDDAIRAEIDALADLAQPWQPAAGAMPLTWKPFPVHVLPEPLRGFVNASASALGCDETYIALHALAVCAACIGTSRVIRLKRTWTEPAVLWCITIGRSGTVKSPPLDLALKPIRRRERDAFHEHAELMAAHEHAMQVYERDAATWRKSKLGGDPPVKPVAPARLRFTVADTTIEAVAALLLENPRGLLLARDELAGWLKGFDAYRGGKGGDAAKWLELHRAGALLVDRKSGEPRTIRVDRAAVSVCGTIQPGTLRRALDREHYESGLAARLLLAMPPAKVKRWTDDELPARIEDAYGAVIDELLALQPDLDDAGEPVPVALVLTPAGKAAWIDFYNAHARAQADAADDDLAAAFSKLEGYAARLALVVHCVRQAAGEAVGDAVDERSIGAGVELAKWFARETQRIYAVLGGDEADDELRRLVDWIRLRGGRVSPRDLTRNLRAYPDADSAKAVLHRLEQAGYGRLTYPAPGPKGGPPATVFQLADSADADTTPIHTSASGSYVGVGSVGTRGMPASPQQNPA